MPVRHFNEAIPSPGLDVPGHVHHFPGRKGTVVLCCPGICHAHGSRLRLVFERTGEAFRNAAPGRTGLLYALVAVGGLAGILLIKPVAPINSALWKITSRINPEVVEMVGWPDLAAQVAKIFQTLPASEKSQTVILAGNYGEAGAMDLYRQEYSLPPVISGADSFWYRGYGDPEPETVIVVGFELSYAEKLFGQCEYAGAVKNQYDVRNEESTRHTGLYVCRQPRHPWSEMWKDMKWFQ